mmetsp:Transcript_5605/g.16694  ORF Transcript_5605/g.16694 Transcript_5605/m.16694 type:complete len:230 (-) Transcript_5605:59-748(-)
MSATASGFEDVVTDFFKTPTVSDLEKRFVESGQAPSIKQTSPRGRRARKNPALLQCSHCKKTFKKRYNLKIHQRSHTGETPLQCSYEGCTLKFKWRSSLINHLRYHAPNGKDRNATFSPTTELREVHAAEAEEIDVRRVHPLERGFRIEQITDSIDDQRSCKMATERACDSSSIEQQFFPDDIISKRTKVFSHAESETTVDSLLCLDGLPSAQSATNIFKDFGTFVQTW